jgi:hypothetical protein
MARATALDYSSFGLYVQHVAADGTITNVSTTANVDPGGFQEPTFGYFGELSNGDLAFQEFGHARADIFDPSTNTLVRDALDVPTGTYAGTGTGASYLSVPTAIATLCWRCSRVPPQRPDRARSAHWARSDLVRYRLAAGIWSLPQRSRN